MACCFVVPTIVSSLLSSITISLPCRSGRVSWRRCHHNPLPWRLPTHLVPPWRAHLLGGHLHQWGNHHRVHDPAPGHLRHSAPAISETFTRFTSGICPEEKQKTTGNNFQTLNITETFRKFGCPQSRHFCCHLHLLEIRNRYVFNVFRNFGLMV